MVIILMQHGQESIIRRPGNAPGIRKEQKQQQRFLSSTPSSTSCTIHCSVVVSNSQAGNLRLVRCRWVEDRMCQSLVLFFFVLLAAKGRRLSAVFIGPGVHKWTRNEKDRGQRKGDAAAVVAGVTGPFQ